MKQLKKLSLEKKEVVNLNDFQMNNIKGGSTAVCATVPIVESVASVVSIVGTVISIYVDGKGESWWNCKPEPTPAPAPAPAPEPALSKKIVTLPDGIRACELDEVYGYAYRP